MAQKKQGDSVKFRPTDPEERQQVAKTSHQYKVGAPCYALYCGPRRDKDTRWVPATVIKVFGSRSYNVRVYPHGPVWRHHTEKLQPRHRAEDDPETEDYDPDDVSLSQRPRSGSPENGVAVAVSTSPEFGPESPRRAKRNRKPVRRCDALFQ